ncbi:MAG: tail fiber domain-containing protein [Anaerostipes hadrus]
MGKTLGYGEITVANMTEPFTVMLTNEAQQFATDSNRKVTSAQSYYTDIIVIRGSQERTDYTIGNITSGSGITVSKNSKRVTFSVSAGTTIGSDAGVIEIPITLDGQTVKKQFSWSCGKQGPQGVKGENGSNFAWNMLSETNCGKKHWRTESSGGKYSVEDFITEDNINAVKLICTEAISTSNWSYVSFKDIKMLKQLKPSTKYTLSYDIKASRSGVISHSICKGNISNFCTNTVVVSNIIGNETWQHISVVLTTNDLKTTPTDEILYLGRNALSNVGYSIIKNLKLVEGDIDTPWSPSQSDIEGRGVAETVQYYLAASQASGVTSSTSGWSTDITTQKLTADKKYLWNCYQTKYSDGTSEPISTPKVIGVYGDKGQNAKNLSITPSSQYFKSTDGGKTFAPNTITIKPTIQGEISFGKWQYSIDGGVSFADVVSGQKGLTVNNNVLTVSKDSSLYSDAVTMVTFRAVANDSSFYDTCSIAKIYDVSDIGDGRNLLWNSNFAKTDETINTSTYTTWGLILRGSTYTATIDTSVKHNNFNTLKVIGTKAGDSGGQDLIYRIKGLNLDEVKFTETDVKYTLSFYAKASIACNFSARYAYDSYAKDTNVALSTDWKRYEIQMHPTTTSYQTSLIFKMDAASTVWFSEFKLEKGSSATGYSTAPEDLQTAILSTKSEISDVSLKVDKNKQAIEQRVEKTTYQQDLNLVKGDISKANEGLNKWRYEIYPKSLFASEYQGKSTMDVFAKNTNLTPSQSVLINDTDLSIAWNYAENYIGYALTFAKFSAAKSVAITFAHDDGAHIYLNGKLIGGSDAYSQTGESLTLDFVKGWNCIEVVVNEGASTEGFKLGTTISAISECQLMNCYYGTPVARQSHITNQLVQNTTDIKGISTKVSKVTSVIGDNGENFTSFKNDYSDFKQTMNGFKTTVGQTYVTKDDFNGLEIGGRNLILNSAFKNSRKEWTDWGNPAIREIVSSNGKTWVHIVGNKQNFQGFQQWAPAGSIKEGDHITFSARIKGSAANQRFTVGIHWINSGNSIISQDWHTFIVDTTENVYTWTVDAKGNGCDKLNLMVGVSDTSAAYNVYFTEIMVVKGNKSSDWTPAPEDNEINGQNLVSNLPSNWEQGTFDGGRVDVGGVYNTGKVDNSTRIRVKELVPVSGTITISNAYSNQSKKPIQHVIAAFDVNKKYLGSGYINTDWSDFPRIVNMKDAKYIAVIVRYKDDSAITPSDISQICLKIERGTSATPFTLAPEDVNGKIVNVETIANQTAKKFEWIVKGGDKSSSMVLTDDFLNIVANNINLTGKVTFNSLSSDAKNEIGKVAQSKVDDLQIGGRNLLVQKNITEGYLSTDGKGSFVGSGGGDQTSDWIDVSGNKYITVTLYEDFTNTNNSGRYCEYDADKNCINTVVYNPRQKSSIIIELKSNTKYIRVTAIECKTRRYKIEAGNKATDWTPAPEDVSQDATNKANQALTDAKNYSSNAVNWVTNNGSSTTSLNSMVKKWTDGAVSDTTQINGGWIKANTITASKIALADFTNYSQLTRDTADAYGFTVTDDTDGTWFSTKNIKRDQFISEIFPCNGGESYLIEYDISTNAKGANNSTDTKNYIGVAIGVYGYTGTVGSNGLPNKATNIWYADRITGSETAPSIHVKTTITTSTATKQFRVFLQSNGYYFEGTTKIRNLSVRRMYGGTLIVDGSITADKIATDAIKSRNYISSGGTQGSFLNLSDGSFTSPNLSWDSNGNLIAKNANLSGEITATNGSIAGWTIISNKMYTTGSGKYTGIGKYGSAYAFWAGATSNDNGNSAVFKVSHTGKLTATDADITGTITATNGKIGRYDITSTYLMTNSGSNASGIGGNQAFWAGAEDSNSAPFRVGYDGVLWAENAAIRGSIETGNLGDEGDTVSIINGHIGIQGTSNNVEIYSTGFKFGIDGDYYLMSVSEGVKCYRNLYATDFVADGWLYCSEVHSSGAVVIGADSESFYWAHGYQIARGTSWGGVCVGDDSQQLRLYGSSIWASHSISTSDENLKENFTTLDQYENFYMNLNPIGFNYIGDYDGKKTHFGFGAHKTEDVLESEGYDADKFAVVTHRPLVQEDIEKRFGKDVEVDIETEYGVSYTEFIALNTHMIQKTRRELTKVKQEKADLEVRLQAIEAKLGL